jgi:hypothetical protein
VPAHHDSSPSLAPPPDETAALVHCQAGCGVENVLCAVKLPPRNLFVPPPVSPGAWLAVARVHVTYPPLEVAAHDSTERLESVHEYGQDYRLERWRSTSGHKRLTWFRRDSVGCWIPGLGGTPTSALPLYRETDIAVCAAADEPLYLVESESSVDALNHAGHYATTWAGGATSPPLERLAAAVTHVGAVRVVADFDVPCLRCARALLVAIPHATGWRPPRPDTGVRDVLAVDPTLATLRPPPEETSS